MLDGVAVMVVLAILFVDRLMRAHKTWRGSGAALAAMCWF